MLFYMSHMSLKVTFHAVIYCIQKRALFIGMLCYIRVIVSSFGLYHMHGN